MSREIHIRLPRAELHHLLAKENNHVTFQTDELGSPLRIVIWGEADKPRAHRFTAPPPEEERDPEVPS